MDRHELIQEAHAIYNGLTRKLGTTEHVKALVAQMIEDNEARNADNEASDNDIGVLQQQLAGMTAHANRLQHKLWAAEGKLPSCAVVDERHVDATDTHPYALRMEGV